MSVDFSDERISAYLDGELPPAERAEIEALLASSSEHRQLVDELRALRATLQDLPRPVLSGDFTERVMQRALQAAAASPHEGLEAGNGDGRGASIEGGGTSVSELALRHSFELRRWRRAFWSVATVAAGLFGVLVVTNLKHYAEVTINPTSNVNTGLAINSYAAHSTMSEFGRAETAAPGAPQDEAELLAMQAAQPDFSGPAAPANDGESEAISGLARTSPPERFGMDLANKSTARRALGDVDGLERAKSAGGVAVDDASRAADALPGLAASEVRDRRAATESGKKFGGEAPAAKSDALNFARGMVRGGAVDGSGTVADKKMLQGGMGGAGRGARFALPGAAAGSAPAPPAPAGLPAPPVPLRKELKTGADEQQLAQLSTVEKLNRKRTFVVRLTMPDKIADEDFVNQSLKKNGIDQNLARLNEDQTANLFSNGAIASQVYGIQAPVFQAQGLVDELRTKVDNTVVYEIPEAVSQGDETLQAPAPGNGSREAGSRVAKPGDGVREEKSPIAAPPGNAQRNAEYRFDPAPQAQVRSAVVLYENLLIQPAQDKPVSRPAPKENGSPQANTTASKAKQDELQKGLELKHQIEQGKQLKELSEQQAAEQQEMVEIILVVDVQRSSPGDKNAPAKPPTAPK